MSGETSRARGRSRELKVLHFYVGLGYAAYRLSRGPADLVALKVGEPPLLIQVKSTGSPFEHFRPADRNVLVVEAARAGAVAVLAWWPKDGPLELIPSTMWPAALGMAA